MFLKSDYKLRFYQKLIILSEFDNFTRDSQFIAVLTDEIKVWNESNNLKYLLHTA